MEKKEALEQTLGMDYTQLIPSTSMKSELFLLTNDEFEKLRKHINITDYQIVENDYDTIIICNRIFKKSNKLNISDVIKSVCDLYENMNDCDKFRFNGDNGCVGCNYKQTIL